jgi:hypothetical protein
MFTDRKFVCALKMLSVKLFLKKFLLLNELESIEFVPLPSCDREKEIIKI